MPYTMRSKAYLFAILASTLFVSACMTDQNTDQPDVSHSRHGYSTNGSYDDNGAAPAPNNGNQNFGMHGN